MSHRVARTAFIGMFGVFIFFAPVSSFAGTQPCESLLSLKLPDTTITTATSVPAGPFNPVATTAGARGPAAVPGGPGVPPTPRTMDVPAFCRVQLTVAPSVKIEIWMPSSGWNGNFEGVGNGGLAGSISYPALAEALRKGYAAASTDTGHEGGNANFAMGDPDHDPILKQRIEDFGYLAIHEMTEKAKLAIQAFYGAAPRESFFSGCSQGGRQALTEAQRYPEDYNGILAGAPAVNYINFNMAHIKVALATLKDEESYVPAAKLGAIQDAALAACDALDGLKDNLITDPRNCHFDPAVLLCQGADSPSCLTAKQVKTMQDLYAPTLDTKGNMIYPAHFPGAEKGWVGFTIGTAPYKSQQYNLGVEFMKAFVFKNADWDFRSWDYGTDIAKVRNPWLTSVMDSWNTDLRPFRDHGGKLIIYQGWGDDDVSPVNTINYYKQVVTAVTGYGKGTDAYSPEPSAFIQASQKTGDFLRLFMIPGMNHCGNGLGPNVFEGVEAVHIWHEKKQPPDQILASHLTNNTVDRTRPLCPYPGIAQYSGKGSPDEAANYACVLPKSK